MRSWWGSCRWCSGRARRRGRFCRRCGIAGRGWGRDGQWQRERERHGWSDVDAGDWGLPGAVTGGAFRDGGGRDLRPDLSGGGTGGWEAERGVVALVDAHGGGGGAAYPEARRIGGVHLAAGTLPDGECASVAVRVPGVGVRALEHGAGRVVV